MARLCPHCQDLTLAHAELPAHSLIQGIEERCKPCALLGGTILWAILYGSAPLYSTIPDHVLSIRIVVDCALYIYLYYKDDEEHENGVYLIELYTEQGKPTSWPNIGPARKVQSSSISAGSIALMRHWLEDCQNRHPSCHNQATSSAKLPSRVIDVGSAADASPRASLRITHGEKSSYVALSHCWGGVKPMSTTKRNLQSHQESIHFLANSLTFAQAVDVTRLLGIRYLWIDSLCIIQDDKDDWEVEAAKMKEIYRNATLTLSADGATDASKGLFSSASAKASTQKTMSMVVSGPNGEPVLVYARLRALSEKHTAVRVPDPDGRTEKTLRERPLWPSDPGSAPHSSLKTSPRKLSTRAWVLQERVLSPRIIHFYEEELVWSCQAQQRCECRLVAATPPSLGGFRRLLAALTERSARDLILDWPKLVEEYTAKVITYAEDRLPAISGLAGLMHERTQSDYHAGLWSSDLAYSLLWISRHDITEEPVRRLGEGVEGYAPTWSWASITGPIQYVRRHQDQFTYRRSGRDEVIPTLKVLRASTVPRSASNIYGPVTEGSITVRGQVLRITLDMSQRQWRPRSEDEIYEDMGALYRGYRTYPTETDVRYQAIFLYDGGPQAMARQPQTLDSYVLLRAATFLMSGIWSDPSTEVVALLLAKVRNGPQGEPIYERRGIVFQAFHKEKVWVHAEEKTITIV